MDEIEGVRQELRRRRLARWWQVRGCTPEEIDEIRESQDRPLPRVYVRFLEVMGRRAGRFFEGTRCFYPALCSVRSECQNAIQESRVEWAIPPEAFVFLNHQGHRFMYFLADGTAEDPAVYVYEFGDRGGERRWESFSAFLLEFVEEFSDHSKARRRS